jgi:hypothetical protein
MQALRQRLAPIIQTRQKMTVNIDPIHIRYDSHLRMTLPRVCVGTGHLDSPKPRTLHANSSLRKLP